MTEILITPDELAEEIDHNPRLRILDVRWRLDRPDGHPDYLNGHIPGAVYVDLDRELATHGEPTDGRHPLPDPGALQTSARSWGINDGDSVVVYDDLKSLSAARAWWVLVDAGIEDVRILDGSLRNWISAGYPLDAGPVMPQIGSVTLTTGLLPRLTIDEVGRLPNEGVLLDVRAEERYRGEVEPIDPRAGHIPGAINAPTTASIDSDGRFLEVEQLRARFRDLGVDDTRDVGVYCGSGVTASHAFVALTLAGFSPRLYPGSWSQWSNHPERPIAQRQSKKVRANLPSISFGVHDGGTDT